MICDDCDEEFDLEERVEKIKKVIRRPAPKDGYISLTEEELDDIFSLIDESCYQGTAYRARTEKADKLIKDLTERVKWLEIELHNVLGQKEVLTNELSSFKKKDI